MNPLRITENILKKSQENAKRILAAFPVKYYVLKSLEVRTGILEVCIEFLENLQ